MATSRALVRLGTWNAGNGTIADLLAALDDFDVIAGDEFGDRNDLRRALRAAGWRILDGDEPGSSSTPLLVAPHVRVIKEITIPVLTRRYIGPGAGPSHNKQKNVNGALLELNGAIFGVVSTHVVASIYRKLRKAAAEVHIEGVRRRFGSRRHPWFVCGDFNAIPSNPILRILYRARWTNNHKADVVRPTHHRRAIDYIWWIRSTKVRLIRTWTVATKSDHRLLGAVFAVSKFRKRG